MVVDLDPRGAGREGGRRDPIARGRPAPGSRPRSRGPGRARRSSCSASASAGTARPSIRVAPMYSPYAVAGSISLVIRVQQPVLARPGPSSPRRRASCRCRARAAIRRQAAGGEQGLLDRHRVHGVAVDQQRAVGHVRRGPSHMRVGVVPDLGLVVVDQGEPYAVPRSPAPPAAPRPRRRRSRPPRPRRAGRPRRSCARAMSRMVVSPSTGTSALGSVSV